METEMVRQEKRSLRFEEASVERSKSFVTALQELKNLRPQLYSAAEYCEKSYLHSEQKQMVLDNLKDYAVRALVNAIDHLGTVAYKLGDVLDQQTSDISSMELKVTCLNQRLLTCQIYTEKEGHRQQQLLAIIPRHHKHYILPNSVNKKVHFGPHIQTDPRQHMQARTRLYSQASETKSNLRGSVRGILSNDNSQTYGKTLTPVNLLDVEQNARMKSAPASSVAMQTLGVAQRDTFEGSKPLTPYRSFDGLAQREVVRPPVRSRSVLSAFFVKQKTPKLSSKA